MEAVGLTDTACAHVNKLRAYTHVQILSLTLTLPASFSPCLALTFSSQGVGH